MKFELLSTPNLNGYVATVGNRRAEVVKIDSLCHTWHCFQYIGCQMAHFKKLARTGKKKAMQEAKNFLRGEGEIMYVILRTDGLYVAPPGQERSYTKKLEEAWTFTTKEEAEANRCKENERVVPVVQMLQKPV